jgi:hypothetical protein
MSRMSLASRRPCFSWPLSGKFFSWVFCVSLSLSKRTYVIWAAMAFFFLGMMVRVLCVFSSSFAWDCYE